MFMINEVKIERPYASIYRACFRLWVVFTVFWVAYIAVNEFRPVEDALLHLKLVKKDRNELMPWELFQLDRIRRGKGCPSVFNNEFNDRFYANGEYHLPIGITGRYVHTMVSDIILDCPAKSKEEIVTDLLLDGIGIPIITFLLGASMFLVIAGLKKRGSC